MIDYEIDELDKYNTLLFFQWVMNKYGIDEPQLEEWLLTGYSKKLLNLYYKDPNQMDFWD